MPSVCVSYPVCTPWMRTTSALKRTNKSSTTSRCTSPLPRPQLVLILRRVHALEQQIQCLTSTNLAAAQAELDALRDELGVQDPIPSWRQSQIDLEVELAFSSSVALAASPTVN